MVVPQNEPNFPQYAYVKVTSTGDIPIVQALLRYRIVITGMILDANGLDQILVIKSGGSSGGQSDTPIGEWQVGPASSVPGITAYPDEGGHAATIVPVDPNAPSDDLVFNVAGTNGNTSIYLSGWLRYELRA